MIKHLNIYVSGRVQGVWYRKSTQDKALQLGIKGFVRSQPDGSVYIEAEGNDAQLKALIEWCKEGPEYSRVKEIKYTQGISKNFSSFDILR